MRTCNRLDLQTLGSQPVTPKNLSDPWATASKAQQAATTVYHQDPPPNSQIEPLGPHSHPSGVTIFEPRSN